MAEPQDLDAFEQAQAFNAKKGQKAADLDTHLRQREAGRDHQPMPAGGLFDLVRRDTQELF